MNIYKFELRMYKKSIMIWGIAIPFFLVFYVSFFPMIAADAEGFNVIFDELPKEFLSFFGMNPDLPMTTIKGYIALTYGMIQIPLAIQASNYGFHMLSVEERELTADFLLTKPVSRKQIILSKFLAALTSLTIVNVAVWVATIFVVIAFSGGSDYLLSSVIVVLSTNLFFQLFFVGVGMFISVTVRKISSVLSYSMGLSFGLYILASLGQLLTSTMFKVFSPFSHFSPSYIMVEGNYDWSIAWVSFVVIILSLSGSYFFYMKRNIASL